jgi:transposase
VTDLFGKAGMEFLSKVELVLSLRKLLDMHLELLDFFTQKIKVVEKWIRKIFKEDKRMKLLTSIPGIGDVFAPLILLEINDINRFSRYDKLWSYAELVPTTYASGKKIYHGRLIKHRNKWLRWAFIEGAHSSIKSSYYFQSYYHKIKVRKGSPTAIVATARKLAKVVYYVLKEDRSYIEITKSSSPSEKSIHKGSSQG